MLYPMMVQPYTFLEYQSTTAFSLNFFSQYQADSNYLTSAFTSRLNEVKEQTQTIYSDKMDILVLYNEKGSHQLTKKKGCWFLNIIWILFFLFVGC